MPNLRKSQVQITHGASAEEWAEVHQQLRDDKALWANLQFQGLSGQPGGPGKRPIGELVIQYLNRKIMLIPMDVEREVPSGCFGLLNIVADQRQLDEAFAMAGESIEKYEVQLLSKDQGIPKFDRLTPDRLSELLMRLLNPKAGG